MANLACISMRLDGLKDGRIRRGHFMDGIGQPTLGVIVVEAPEHLRRLRRPDLGIALIAI